MSRFNGRLAAVLAMGAIGGTAIGTLGAVAGAQSPAGGDDTSSIASSLASAPNVDTETQYSKAQVRQVGVARGAEYPLPAGGTFSGIRWENGGDTVRESAIDAVLSYNAACQWLRAWRDGRDAGTALNVLSEAPDWPVFRDTDSGRFVALAGEEAAAGGGETATNMLRDCDRSHQDEVAYAKEQGLPPSS